MTELPYHLLEALASEAEQRRYIENATVDEYLVPEEVINDAWHFQERARRAEVWINLSADQQQAVERLQAAIEAAPDGWEASLTLLDDPPWALMRQRAKEALAVFGRSLPKS